jgi:hypothetical protein
MLIGGNLICVKCDLGLFYRRSQGLMVVNASWVAQ